MVFRDRHDGGQQLTTLLESYRGKDCLILALPRGGVPVAAEVAHHLGAPLDILVVRKLGAPGFPEFGMGAIAEGGATCVDPEVRARLNVTEAQLSSVIHKEERELERRIQLYRGDHKFPDIKGKDVILVDDGIATGGTARAAIQALRAWGPRRIVLAVPVVAADTAKALSSEVDALVYVEAPVHFRAVGAWYTHFDQTTDAEVIALLNNDPYKAPSG